MFLYGLVFLNAQVPGFDVSPLWPCKTSFTLLPCAQRKVESVVDRTAAYSHMTSEPNPMSSMIWQTPQIQRLLRDSRVKLCPLEMCMYNTQWKKPTFILLWNAPATNFLRCTGRRVCTRTGKSHMQLTGISGKRFLTEQAQVYSKEFSKALMLTFLHDPKTPPP